MVCGIRFVGSTVPSSNDLEADTLNNADKAAIESIGAKTPVMALSLLT